MAKIVDVTYGTEGKSNLYSYVVNDNVRVGQVINPSVKHYRSGLIFGTTAIIQKTANENSVAGKKMKAQSPVELAQVETARGLNIRRNEIGGTGKFQSATGGKGPVTYDEAEGVYRTHSDNEFQSNPYIDKQRTANVDRRIQSEYNLGSEKKVNYEDFDKYIQRTYKEEKE